jgi:hypothetical protein
LFETTRSTFTARYNRRREREVEQPPETGRQNSRSGYGMQWQVAGPNAWKRRGAVACRYACTHAAGAYSETVVECQRPACKPSFPPPALLFASFAQPAANPVVPEYQCKRERMRGAAQNAKKCSENCYSRKKK